MFYITRFDLELIFLYSEHMNELKQRYSHDLEKKQKEEFPSWFRKRASIHLSVHIYL